MKRTHTIRFLLAAILTAFIVVCALSKPAYALDPPAPAPTADQTTGTLSAPAGSAPGAGTGAACTPTPAAGCPDASAAGLSDSGDGTITGNIILKVEQAITAWFMESAAAVVTHVLTMVTTASTPVVNGNAQTGDWFAIEYQMMMNVGWWLMLPMLFVTVIHSVLKGSMQLLVRSLVMYLPMAVLGTVIATSFIQLLIGIVDDMCNVFTQLIAKDLVNFGVGLNKVLLDNGFGVILGLFIAFVLTIFSLYLWVVFLLRDSSLYMAVCFMPVGFAMMVWPVAARYFRRMVEFLVGIIVSKLVMVVIISLSIAALAGSTGATTAGQAGLTLAGTNVQAHGPNDLKHAGPNDPPPVLADPTAGTAQVAAPNPNDPNVVANPATGGVATTDGASNNMTAAEIDTGPVVIKQLGYVVPALVMLLLAALSPTFTVQLVGNIGIGQMARQVADALNTQNWLYQYIGAERWQRILIGSAERDQGPIAIFNHWKNGREIKKNNQQTTQQDEMMKGQGVHRNADGSILNWENIYDSGMDVSTEEQMERVKVYMWMANESNNANMAVIARKAVENDWRMQETGKVVGLEIKDGQVRLVGATGTVLEYDDGSSDLFMNVADNRTGQPINFADTHMLRRMLNIEAERQRAREVELLANNSDHEIRPVAINVITPVLITQNSGDRNSGKVVGKNRRQETWRLKINETVSQFLAQPENVRANVTIENRQYVTMADMINSDPDPYVAQRLDHPESKTPLRV